MGCDGSWRNRSRSSGVRDRACFPKRNRVGTRQILGGRGWHSSRPPQNFGRRSLRSSSLHFHSLKRRFECGIREVADFHAPVFSAVDAIVFYFQSTFIFPSWTSRVRVPTCWDRRPRLPNIPPGGYLPTPPASRPIREVECRRGPGLRETPPVTTP